MELWHETRILICVINNQQQPLIKLNFWRTTMNKKIIATIIGGVGLLGMTSQASALNLFKVNPDIINGTAFPTSFDATNIAGLSSGLINLTPILGGGGTATESGWLNFTQFNNGASTVAASTSGVGGVAGGYQLYAEFSLTATYSSAQSIPSGTFGKNGSGYNLDALLFTMYADPTNNTVFTSANSSGLGTQASFVDGGGDKITLASGSLIPGQGQAFINNAGVALNALTSFNLTGPLAGPDGKEYFFDPSPFYILAFDAFNNTGGAVVPDYLTSTGCAFNSSAATKIGGCQIAVTSGVGTIDFQSVPEPATLALLGIGLLGIGASSRRGASRRGIYA